LFWEGHIGLKSPKTTKADAEDVEEDVMGGGLSPPQPTRGFGERRITSPSGVWGRAPAANDFWALHMQFCVISCMF